LLGGWMRRISVFSSFNLSLFEVIQHLTSTNDT
jgi:hypothetical protein